MSGNCVSRYLFPQPIRERREHDCAQKGRRRRNGGAEPFTQNLSMPGVSPPELPSGEHKRALPSAFCSIKSMLGKDSRFQFRINVQKRAHNKAHGLTRDLSHSNAKSQRRGSAEELPSSITIDQVISIPAPSKATVPTKMLSQEIRRDILLPQLVSSRRLSGWVDGVVIPAAAADTEAKDLEKLPGQETLERMNAAVAAVGEIGKKTVGQFLQAVKDGDIKGVGGLVEATPDLVLVQDSVFPHAIG